MSLFSYLYDRACRPSLVLVYTVRGETRDFLGAEIYTALSGGVPVDFVSESPRVMARELYRRGVRSLDVLVNTDVNLLRYELLTTMLKNKIDECKK